MFSFIELMGKKSEFTCLLALPVAVAGLCIDSVTLIASLGEMIIKGLVNIFGAPFSPTLDASRGMLVIATSIPFSIYFCSRALFLSMIVFYKVLCEGKDIFGPVSASIYTPVS